MCSSFCTTRDNTKKSGFNICGVTRIRAWYSYITINLTCRSRFCRLVHIFKEHVDTVMLALLICPCIVEQSHSSENMPRTDISSQTQLVLELQNDEKKPRKSSKLAGKVLLGVTGAAAVGLVLVTTPFVTPALRKICLPYVPATERQITNVLHMAQGVKGQGSKLVDLGSGDGRVVIAAARQGYRAHGYELNQWLVWYSRLQARLQGLNKRATFSRADLWKVKLTTYDTIVIFGVSEMMQKLQDKFQVEMKDDARVLACRFPLPNWKPTQVIEEGIDSVWLYHKPKP